MQSRSVEFASKFGVVFEVRSSFNDNQGTIVKAETKQMEDVVIRGVTVDKNQAKVTLTSVPDKPGIAARVFKALGEANVNVDMIVQSVGEKGHTDISFTVAREDAAKSIGVLQPIVREIGARDVSAHDNVAKLSVVGIGMRSHSGVAGQMFEALAQNNVNIQMISTSEIKISVVIDRADADKACQAVHEKFGLGN
jgi:aspartate kinase